MEHSYNGGAYSRTQNIPEGRILEGKTSADAPLAQSASRLQNQRSNISQRVEQDNIGYGSTPGDNELGERTSSGGGMRGRKASIRYTLRRMFGRRSRNAELQPAPLQTQTSPLSPQRHAYHRSEPLDLSPPQAFSEQSRQPRSVRQQTISAPLAIVPPSSVADPENEFLRSRSPYAVEFPHSSRLKPLDLGNPLPASGRQLRRRQTLPSMLVGESEAATVSAAIGAAGSTKISSPTGKVGAIGDETDITDKRKSKSADDLQRLLPRVASSPRKRSEEVRVLRESVQGSVLRASGFRVPSARKESTEDDRTPIRRSEDPWDSKARPCVSSPSQREQRLDDRDVTSPSAVGTELARELEDRVAKLESGLEDFQTQFKRFANDHHRRTRILAEDAPKLQRRASGSNVSVLARDLETDLEPSTYRYEYTAPTRPLTSPQRDVYERPQREAPRTPTRVDPVVGTPPDLPVQGPLMDDPFVSPSRPPVMPTATERQTRRRSPRRPPQHTVDSLHQMVRDERSARQQLEAKMKQIQRDLENLHYQVSLQSDFQSQRSSYQAPFQPTAGSSRLRAFLRDTERSPPNMQQSEQRPQSARASADQAAMVSRFSASESEMEGAVDVVDPQIHGDAYQRLTGEQTSFPSGDQSRTEGGMF